MSAPDSSTIAELREQIEAYPGLEVPKGLAFALLNMLGHERRKHRGTVAALDVYRGAVELSERLEVGLDAVAVEDEAEAARLLAEPRT